MKVEKNITIFAGAEPDYSHVTKADGKTDGKSKDRKTIYAGDLKNGQNLQDRIKQRKDQARQQALKIIRDAWAGDQAIDQSLDESRQYIREMQEENRQAQGELRAVEEKREGLKKQYGVTDKTPEEAQPEEYKQRMKELDEYASFNEDIVTKNKRDIMVENAVIRGIRKERLKKAPMVEAKEEADEVLEAAGDEIVGMVLDESREHLEEEQAKREEQAEKIEEKREELEELLEKRDEKREELEELIEDIPVKDMLELERSKSDIRQEIQSIMDKMKMVAEDIKGSMVDANV